MREREAVGVLAPLLHVLAGLVELEELGRLRAARRPDVAAARVDEQVFLGIDGDAHGFADGVTGRHQRQRDGVVGNLRRVLFELGLRGHCRLSVSRNRRCAGRRLGLDVGGARERRRECNNESENGVLHGSGIL